MLIRTPPSTPLVSELTAGSCTSLGWQPNTFPKHATEARGTLRGSLWRKVRDLIYWQPLGRPTSVEVGMRKVAVAVPPEGSADKSFPTWITEAVRGPVEVPAASGYIVLLMGVVAGRLTVAPVGIAATVAIVTLGSTTDIFVGGEAVFTGR